MKKPMGAHQNKCLKKPSKLVNVTNLNKIFSKFLKTCFVSSRPASRVLDAGVEPVSGGRDRDRLHLQGGPLQRGRPQQGRISTRPCGGLRLMALDGQDIVIIV
jgi:hypothetical protein